MWDYLEPLATLLDDAFTVARFEQRGCGRSTGTGPYTIAQAVDDLEQLRAALRVDRWAVLGHSWGAELALRYAAHHPNRTTAVLYVAGIGAGEDYLEGYIAERDRRLGTDLRRWEELRGRARTPDEECEWCLLQWRPDFAPSADPLEHARALWRTRPDGVALNATANRELWADRTTENLLDLARGLPVPVTMLFGADDPRPWSAADALYEALPRVRRLVLDDAGHAPWVERPDETRAAIVAGLHGLS